MAEMESKAEGSNERWCDIPLSDRWSKRQKPTHTYSRSISNIGGGKCSAPYRGMHLPRIVGSNAGREFPNHGMFIVQSRDNTKNTRKICVPQRKTLRAAARAEFLVHRGSESISPDATDRDDASNDNDTTTQDIIPFENIEDSEDSDVEELPSPGTEFLTGPGCLLSYAMVLHSNDGEAEEVEEDWGGLNREVPAKSTTHDVYDRYGILPETINPLWPRSDCRAINVCYATTDCCACWFEALLAFHAPSPSL
jgi:hypothetical protein